jgi:DNA-binding protein
MIKRNNNTIKTFKPTKLTHNNNFSVQGAKMTEKKEEQTTDNQKPPVDNEKPSNNANENVVFVGSKPVMNYVLAVVTQFNNGHENVHVEARGRAISRAVDVAEIVRKRFLNELKIGSIDIDTEELKSNDNEKVNVSTIKISLGK